MEKLYKKIGWKNRPNLATPLGATNLNKMDAALDGLDNRTIEMNESIATNRRNIELLYPRVEKNESAIEGLTEKSNDIDMLKIVSTASGSPAYMEDASNMGLEGIDFFGESTQVQTTGKNLFGFEKSAIDVTEELRKLDNQRLIFTKINDNSIKCNYSWGTYATGFVELNGVDGTKNYAFSFDVKNNTLGFTPRIEKYTQECTSEKLVLSIYSGSGATEVSGNEYFILENIQVEEGTTATSFEPYTGGKASPNPDFPQPIESKVVNMVDVLGKNLLKFSQGSTTIEGVTFTVNADKSVTVNGTPTGDAVLLLTTSTRGEVDLKRLKGNKIILSGCPKGGSSSTYRFQFWSDSKMAVDTGNGATLDLSTVPDTWNFAISIISGTTVNNQTFYPMIRLANITDATYEPYQSQTVNLSAPIELNGIGGVRDTDKLKNIYVKVFTGNESFRTYTPGVGGIQFGCEDENISQIESDNVLCTHLPPKFTWNVREDGIAVTSSSSVVVRFRIESLGISTVEDLKAKLKEWYDAGNPMVLYAPIKTPIETALPQADIDAIKALHSYKPNTVVMNNGNAEMDVHYVADAKTYIDKKFEALASAIVNQ